MSNYGQVVYKLKHKETGYYFDPRGYRGNVSILGKVFTNRKPPRQSFIDIPYDIIPPQNLGWLKERYKETELTDWEVEEFTLTKLNREK